MLAIQPGGNMRMQLTVCCLLLICQGQALIVPSVNLADPGIPPPSSAHMYSINYNHFMNWTYPNLPSSLNRTVVFDVQLKENWDDYWLDVCNHTTEKRCDIISPIIRLDGTCRRYNNEYDGRVRACLADEKDSTKCSPWVESQFELPRDDQFSEPDFEIVGVYHETQIKIRNKPLMVKHTNLSLDCFYDGKLQYEIHYWTSDDQNVTKMDNFVGFEMETIWLHLLYEPQHVTSVCARMAIVHKVYKHLHKVWGTRCSEYTPRRKLSPTFVALGAGIALILILTVIALVRKFRQIQAKFWGSEIKFPTDLNELMNDGSFENAGAQILDVSESAFMISFNSILEINESPTAKHQDCALDICLSKSESQTSFAMDNYHKYGEHSNISHAESIPYIINVEDRPTFCRPNDELEAAKRAVANCVISDCGSEMEVAYILPSGETIPYAANREVSNTPPLSIEQLARARLQSNSMTDLSGFRPEFANVDRLRRSCSTDNIRKSEFNEYCNTTKCNHIKSKADETYNFKTAVNKSTDNQESLQDSANDAHAEIDAINPEGEKVVCIENPTYNPNPDIFDFLDHKFYRVNKKLLSTEAVPSSNNQSSNIATSFEKDRNVAPYVKRRGSCCDHRTPQSDGFIPETTHTNDTTQESRPLNLPSRIRYVSDDSGYHVENLSLSDGSSISPPVSPDYTSYPDVFAREHSYPVNANHSHANHEGQGKLLTVNVNQQLYSTTDSLDDEYFQVSESPYVTEGSLQYNM